MMIGFALKGIFSDIVHKTSVLNLGANRNARNYTNIAMSSTIPYFKLIVVNDPVHGFISLSCL